MTSRSRKLGQNRNSLLWYICEVFLLLTMNILWQLAEYQEQSYLLDPFLEELVTPILEHLKSYARSVVVDPSKCGSSIRVNRLSTLLYHYCKFRGHKTISQSMSGIPR